MPGTPRSRTAPHASAQKNACATVGGASPSAGGTSTGGGLGTSAASSGGEGSPSGNGKMAAIAFFLAVGPISCFLSGFLTVARINVVHRGARDTTLAPAATHP